MTIFESQSLHELSQNTNATILTPGDDGYAEASSAFGHVGSPAVVVQPTTAQATAAAVIFAREHELVLSVRCGGHSGSGYSTNHNGMVIDLSRMRGIELVDDATRVRIAGGTTWGEVAEALRPFDLALSSGDTSSVGVGGLTLGGGVGWMVRQYGLALDSLVEAEVVTAAGQIVVASAHQHEDLFWALRGGGGNFGVVTSFVFEAHPLDGVFSGAIQLDGSNLASALKGWRDAMRAAPEQLNTTFLAMPEYGGMPAGTQILACYAGSDEAAARAALEPLLNIPGVVGHGFEPMAYVDVLEEAEGPEPGTVTMVDNNAFAPEVSDAAIDSLAGFYASTPGSVLMIRYLRGAFNRVPEEATAFAFRDSEMLFISAAFLPPDAPSEAVAGIRQGWSALAPYVRGMYGNFSSAIGDAATPLIYPPATLARLEEIKGVYDPGNLFSQNHNIRPRAMA